MPKPAAAIAPTLTLEQATEMLGRYAALQALGAKVQAMRQAKLARTNKAADLLIAPILKEIDGIVTQLKPWWIGARAQLLEGKKKSAEIGACLIGNRTSPAKVIFVLGDDKAAIAALKALRGSKALLKTTTNLDRPAILKQLGTKGAMATKLTALGFKSDQDEIFFIEPLPSAPLGQATRSTQAAA